VGVCVVCGVCECGCVCVCVLKCCGVCSFLTAHYGITQCACVYVYVLIVMQADICMITCCIHVR